MSILSTMAASGALASGTKSARLPRRRASARPKVAAVCDRSCDPVAALLHCGVWQANNDNIRVAAGAVDLYLDFVCVHSVNLGGINFGQHYGEVARETAAGEAWKI